MSHSSLKNLKILIHEEIKKVIEEKEKTGKISIKKEGSSKPAEVVDLLSKLKQSLEEAKKLKKNAS